MMAEVALDGEIDVAAGEWVLEKFRAALRSSPGRIQLDLGQVSFIDCAGLGALERALDLAHAAGCVVRIVATSVSVLRLFELNDRTGSAAP